MFEKNFVVPPSNRQSNSLIPNDFMFFFFSFYFSSISILFVEFIRISVSVVFKFLFFRYSNMDIIRWSEEKKKYKVPTEYLEFDLIFLSSFYFFFFVHHWIICIHLLIQFLVCQLILFRSHFFFPISIVSSIVRFSVRCQVFSFCFICFFFLLCKIITTIFERWKKKQHTQTHKILNTHNARVNFQRDYLRYFIIGCVSRLCCLYFRLEMPNPKPNRCTFEFDCPKWYNWIASTF